MNLRWNGSLFRWEAEFSSDFHGDLAAVKAAGFRTDGAPTWIWHTSKVGNLVKLRENRPASGLSITPEAREQFTSLLALEQKNAEVKAKLAEHKKALKTEQIKKKKVCSGNSLLSYYDVENECWVDPPRSPAIINPSPAPPRPLTHDGLVCFICGIPVYFYEKLDPPTCLWCEKTVLDVSEI